MQEANYVCHCMKITKDNLIQTILQIGPNPSVEYILNNTKAGSACRACHSKIKKIINEVKNEH